MRGSEPGPSSHPPPLPCFAMDRTAQVSLSKASSSLSVLVREEEGAALSTIYPRGFMGIAERGVGGPT